MRLCTPLQMKEIERLTGLEFGISDEILMEAAGALSAREIQQSFLPEISRGRVVVLCGPGNNGGDGLVVARYLYSQGYLATEVYTVAPPKHQSKLFKLQLDRAAKQGIKITQLDKEPQKVEGLLDFSLVVDALFGTGIDRDVEGVSLEAIKVINASSAQVVSLDIPSGLSGHTGNVYGAAVRANMTLTFGLAKPGLIVGAGPECVGKLRVIQIGFPRRLFREIAKTHFTFNERLARRWLPVRTKDSNKAKNGHLLVIAGKPGMWGAAAMTCEAAYRLGAGYVTLAAPAESEAAKFLGAEIGSEILVTHRQHPALFDKKTAVVIGPGAGVDDNLKRLIERMIHEKIKKVLIDADGLTVLAQMKGVKLPPTWLLTPHAGEMSRLLGEESETIENNRFYFAGLAAKKFGCFVLLKGYRSILADPEERFAVVMSGNPSLSKAGTGDVLSGMIGGLMAQGLGPVQAGGTAAYLHGRTSDDWVRTGHDMKSFMPRDILNMVPELMAQLSREA